MVYNGIVNIRKEYEGSKSEGNYTYLNTGQIEYRLFRMEVYPADDDFFLPYEGKNVEVEGIVTDNWLSVENISEVLEENIAIESTMDNCTENDIEGDICSEKQSCECCNKREDNEKDVQEL